ncbi:MAG: DegT/DnrJ/EryC1/StrS family aminotransferase [Methanomassiliicoccales archaeon]
MRVPMCIPPVTEEMIQAAADALRNERLVLGESVFEFEEAFARYIGTKEAVSVSSGTTALSLALLGMGLDGEVITTPFSFIATASSIVHAGGTCQFADVREEDYLIDPEEVERVTGPGSKAIMPVHLYGHPCEMDRLVEIAEAREMDIIEDAAQAHGAEFRGSRVGSLGRAGCFSFYPTKNMTVGGDGGMVTTDDQELADTVRKLRDCGRVSKYLHDVFGFTARLNTSNAAFGLVQLRYLDEWNDRRRRLAGLYSRLLDDVEGVGLPPMGAQEVIPVFHLFTIRCRDRDSLQEFLKEKEIDTGVHYPRPIHLQPAYTERFGSTGNTFPVSESLSGELLSLPIYPSMSEDQVRFVCESIFEFYS